MRRGSCDISIDVMKLRAGVGKELIELKSNH